jgi:hypothetical protein
MSAVIGEMKKKTENENRQWRQLAKWRIQYQCVAKKS